jgi:hypothetical protein
MDVKIIKYFIFVIYNLQNKLECLSFLYNGKESTVNRALGGSTYPG